MEAGDDGRRGRGRGELEARRAALGVDAAAVRQHRLLAPLAHRPAARAASRTRQEEHAERDKRSKHNETRGASIMKITNDNETTIHNETIHNENYNRNENYKS